MKTRIPTSKVTKREISFGNPALGTCRGYVYTYTPAIGEDDHDHDHEKKGRKDATAATTTTSKSSKKDITTTTTTTAKDERDVVVEDEDDDEYLCYEDEYLEYEYNRIVALCSVPPEQVPEGILNLARSHRPAIEHVRIVISNNANAKDDDDDANDNDNDDDSYFGIKTTEEKNTDCNIDDEEKVDDVKQQQLHSLPMSMYVSSSSSSSSSSQRTYLVLISLRTPEAARSFVDDLHGKPYTTLEKDVIASIYPVCRLERDDHTTNTLQHSTANSNPNKGGGGGGVMDGISLMSPFSEMSLNGGGGAATTTTGTLTATTMSEGHRKQSISHDDETIDRSTQQLQQHLTLSSLASLSGTSSEVHNCPVCLEKMELSTRKRPRPIQQQQQQQQQKLQQQKQQQKQRYRGSNKGKSSKTSQHHNKISLPSISIPKVKPPATTPASPSSLTNNHNSTASSIFTTVCNHTFHMECLMRCQDSPCPVCRYDHSGLNEILSQCHKCGTTDNIYICLICGVASCWNNNDMGYTNPIDHVVVDDNIQNSGRGTRILETGASAGSPNICIPATTMTEGHAALHYTETHHAYALDTQTQHVWDFVGRGYVHRLLHNVDDGKIVESHDPDDTTSHGMRSLVPPGSTEGMEEGEAVHRKLEGFADQYCTLLKSQLEHQRVYYGGVLEGIRRGKIDVEDGGDGDGSGGRRHRRRGSGGFVAGRRKKGTTSRRASGGGGNNYTIADSSTDNHSTASDLLAALKQDRNQLQQRSATLRGKYEKVVDNITFLKNLNESLEANKEPMRKQIGDARREINETRDMTRRCIPPLEEKVRLLILQIEADGES